MISGSYEVAWRLAEADPKQALELYGRALETDHCAINSELELMEHNPAKPESADTLLGPYAHRLYPDQTAPTPQPSLGPNLLEYTYTSLRDERIACIGAGAIIMSSYLIGRGVSPENVTLIDGRGNFGGVWREEWAQTAGFNNPKPLQFADRRLSLGNRSGHNMAYYLQGIASDYLQSARLVRGRAVDLRRERRGDRSWVVSTEQDGDFRADSVMLATGRPHPRPINGEYIRSNLDTVAPQVSEEELRLERHQRKLTDEELGSGRPLILVGLGNSTAAMLTQIHEYEVEAGDSVNYCVVTHYPREAIEQPSLEHDDQRSIFRKPAEGYLTGYSGDLPSERNAYFRAVWDGAIQPEVTDLYYDPLEHKLVCSGTEGIQTFTEPHVFGLVGYDRDLTLFRQMGALSRGLWRGDKKLPDIRRADGAVYTHRDGYLSNVYAVGAVAADKSNPNAAVIPGIQAQAPKTSLTIALRAMARRSQS